MLGIGNSVLALPARGSGAHSVWCDTWITSRCGTSGISTHYGLLDISRLSRIAVAQRQGGATGLVGLRSAAKLR